MGAKILFCCLLITAILFIDYVILTLVGCTALVCKATDSFFCTVFCKLVIFLVVFSSMLPFMVAAYKTFIKKQAEEFNSI